MNLELCNINWNQKVVNPFNNFETSADITINTNINKFDLNRDSILKSV